MVISFFSFFSIKNDKIIINNFSGKGFGDNPKYVSEYFLNKKDLKIIWIVEKFDEEMPESIFQVKKRSLKYYYHLSTSKIWLSNVRMFVPIKRKGQIYIQTWHGFGPKRIEKDVENKLSKYYVNGAKNDSAQCDLLISSSRRLTEILQNSFWYDGDILEMGSPRNDILVNTKEDFKKNIKNKYHLDLNTRYLLYAPTFRKNYDISLYYSEWDEVIKILSGRDKCKWKVLIRFHPNIMKLTKRYQNFTDEIIDVSAIPDMQELLCIADILITDYSSSITDYLLTNKPAFLYCPDIEDYKKDRDFYFNIDKITGRVCRTEDELISNIKQFDYEEYLANINKFKAEMGMIESDNASNILARIILEKLGQ